MIAADFLYPGRLWLLVVVVALAGAYVAVLRWRRRVAVRFTQVELLDQVATSRPGWRRHVVAALQLAGLAAGVVAIARPIESSTERTQSEGRILLLFDVSLSMMAEDVSPTRLDGAKAAAEEFVDQVDDDVEIGLLPFAGTVDIEVDPTLDRERLREGIEALELAESTAIGDALVTGTRLLTRLAADTDGGGTDDEELAPGAIVLLTDGETTVGRPTEEGGQEAADAGVPVFTIAFGTAGGTIVDPTSGEVVPVPVRPLPLEAVSALTGGASYEAATTNELSDAYERIRDSLGETLGEEIQVVTELTWRWAAIAMALLASAWALALWWLRGMV